MNNLRGGVSSCRDFSLTGRNKVLDAAKGIGILLVVFAHLNYIEPKNTIIYSFHMPLFYMLSGMLFCREKYPTFGQFVKRRFITLLAPYLFFSFLSLLYTYGVRLIADGYSISFLKDFFGSFVQIFIAQYSKKCVNVPLWFVPSLFLVECIYYCLSKIQNRFLFVGGAALLVIIGWFSESAYCPIDCSILPWNMSSTLFAVGFYAIGNVARPLVEKFLLGSPAEQKTFPKILYATVCLVILIPLALLNGKVSLGSRILQNGFLLYITGVCGALMILLIANLLQKSRTLCFFGKNSFTIMSTHMLFQNVIDVAAYKIFKISLEDNAYQWLPSIIMFIVVIFMCCLFACVYNKLIRTKTQRKFPY